MIPLNKLFNVTYGTKLDLNKLTPTTYSQGGINFVGRSSQNHGVSEIVSPIEGIEPFEQGLITVALGGSKLLSSFIQEAPFYTAQNVAVLRPINPMSFQQKLYACLAIRHNRFRYSAFGREANRTLRTLLIPELEKFPKWISDFKKGVATDFESSSLVLPTPSLDVGNWKYFSIESLFNVKKGKRLTKANMLLGALPYIGATDSGNGVTARIGQEPIHDGNTISVTYDGSIAEAFYQPVPFWASDAVNVLYPKFDMRVEHAIFLCTIIRQEKYRYNYGRKWHLERMKESLIRLPATSENLPDWEYMERFVRTLSYSSQIA